jgi:hypothetical protein
MESQMSGTRNTNITLVEVTSDDSVGVRKATQVLAATIFAALFAVPVTSAAIKPPVQPAAQPSRLASTTPLLSNVHTPGVQSEPGAPPAPRAPHRIYYLGSFARTSPTKVKASPAVHALVLRGQALNRFYHLGSYARTSPAKVKASTKPTAVKIAANPTGGSANKVQQVFSIH